MSVGVQVISDTTPTTGQSGGQDAGAFFVAGVTERGAVNAPIAVGSLSDARSKIGGFVSYGAVDDALAQFFAEGGSLAYVCRAVGAAATVGTRNLVDAAAANAIRVDAANPGAWSANIKVEVQNGLATNSRRIRVTYLDTLVEQFDNLLTADAVVTALASSRFVRGTKLAAGTLPAVAAAAALSAGSDDRVSVNAAALLAALNMAGPEFGSGTVAIPSQPHTTVGQGLEAYGKAMRRKALIATGPGLDVTAAAAASSGLRNSAGSEKAGLFYPWLNVPDGAGGVRLVSPEGTVAGRYAARVAKDGPGHAPAGEAGRLSYAISAERALTQDDVDTLAEANVNPLWQSGSTIRLYGWWSLSPDQDNYRWLSDGDVLDQIAIEGRAALQPYVFGTIDGAGQIFSEIETDLSAVCDKYRQSGVIYERLDVDPGYRVDTGPDVNTNDTIAAGEIRAAVSVRTSPLAELITMVLIKTAVPATL